MLCEDVRCIGDDIQKVFVGRMLFLVAWKSVYACVRGWFVVTGYTVVVVWNGWLLCPSRSYLARGVGDLNKCRELCNDDCEGEHYAVGKFPGGC